MSALIQATAIPLTQPSTPKVDPCVVVIFGASGDLTRRKLVPALYDLAHDGSLSRDVIVLGIGQDHMTEKEFRDQMLIGVSAAQKPGEVVQEEWAAFAARLFYTTGELKDSATYRDLAGRLEKMARQDGASANHLFYCATPPSLAPSIVEGLGRAGLAAERNGWARIILEKPFGRDRDSASVLNDTIAMAFSEHQVFRIDHYLGKETVQNILVFRFGNALFEPVWNRSYVDYIEITAAETLGVGHRAGYYEEAGAVRDMVANHLLQLLALTAMEPPLAFEANAVRDEKVRVWRAMHPMNSDEVAARTVRGQYGAGVVEGQPAPATGKKKACPRTHQLKPMPRLSFGSRIGVGRVCRFMSGPASGLDVLSPRLPFISNARHRPCFRERRTTALHIMLWLCVSSRTKVSRLPSEPNARGRSCGRRPSTWSFVIKRRSACDRPRRMKRCCLTPCAEIRPCLPAGMA